MDEPYEELVRRNMAAEEEFLKTWRCKYCHQLSREQIGDCIFTNGIHMNETILENADIGWLDDGWQGTVKKT